MCILNFLSLLLPIDEVAVYDENGNFIRYESLESPKKMRKMMMKKMMNTNMIMIMNMNKWLFWIIKFILEILIVAVVPMAIACGVSIPNAGWFSIISFIILDLRDWFIEINKTKNIDENI